MSNKEEMPSAPQSDPAPTAHVLPPAPIGFVEAPPLAGAPMPMAPPSYNQVKIQTGINLKGYVFALFCLIVPNLFYNLFVK